MSLFIAILLSNLSLALSITWVGDFSKFSSWNIQYSYLPENRQVVTDPKGGSEMVFRVKYPANHYSTTITGGTAFYVYPFPNITHGHAAFEYQVLFPASFDYVKGGKLPGLFGGRSGCNGGYSAIDCFSGRFMWGPGGGGYAYLYLPKTAPHIPEFCQLTGYPGCTQEFGYGLAGFKYFDKDRWVKIREEIKLNTPGVPNGVLKISIDGVQKFSYDKIIFRLTNNVPINGIVFETFFGGNTPDWATPREQYVYFKGFRYDVL